MDLLNKYSHFKENRSFWKQRLVAVGLALFVTTLIILSVTMLTLGTIVISYLQKVQYFPSSTIPTLITLFNFFVVGLIVLGIIGAIYFLCTCQTAEMEFL
jgi:uncharacterized BrkB/YihY/UPF0761 family membrane protein